MSWQIDLGFAGSNACAITWGILPGAPTVSLTPETRQSPRALRFRFRLRRLEADAIRSWVLEGLLRRAADEEMAPAIAAWAQRLRLVLGEAFAARDRLVSPAGSGRRTCAAWAVRQRMPALTLETSHQSNGGPVFGIEDCRGFGRRLADAITKPRDGCATMAKIYHLHPAHRRPIMEC